MHFIILVVTGIDAIVIDTTHGHSTDVLTQHLEVTVTNEGSGTNATIWSGERE
ncbi:hypothetical protein [Oceanobacillus rekensis]|uniref:hypothetical protein n=1 Tax=Oceanobacillus rekensis TaxID=937927 RepID=UPI001594DDF5|nr:hypothetical protein [Oceanobacillus rekensis]